MPRRGRREAAGTASGLELRRAYFGYIDHRGTPARLRRVNRQLALWDELEAMQLMPPSPRPWVEVPELDRETLRELRAELVGARGELEG